MGVAKKEKNSEKVPSEKRDLFHEAKIDAHPQSTITGFGLYNYLHYLKLPQTGLQPY